MTATPSSGVKFGRAIWHQLPAILAIIVVAGIYTFIARDSNTGSGIFAIAIIGTLLVLRLVALWRGHQQLERQFAIIMLGALTVALALVTGLTIRDILDASTRLIDLAPNQAQSLLREAALVWVMNILVFSIWYWDLDGGGPARRRRAYLPDDLLFPQSSLTDNPRYAHWQPHYVDYLFTAFTTSTAFGPDDTSVLSTRVKLLTMIQTLISMTLILMVIAYALSAL